MITDKEILDALELYGLKPEQLTSFEMEQLKVEIEKRKKGTTVLDSVLDNPEIYYRHLKK